MYKERKVVFVSQDLFSTEVYFSCVLHMNFTTPVILNSAVFALPEVPLLKWPLG